MPQAPRRSLQQGASTPTMSDSIASEFFRRRSRSFDPTSVDVYISMGAPAPAQSDERAGSSPVRVGVDPASIYGRPPTVAPNLYNAPPVAREPLPIGARTPVEPAGSLPVLSGNPSDDVCRQVAVRGLSREMGFIGSPRCRTAPSSALSTTARSRCRSQEPRPSSRGFPPAAGYGPFKRVAAARAPERETEGGPPADAVPRRRPSS
jgi:hypothetical protein